MNSKIVSLFGLEFDNLNMEEALEKFMRLVQSDTFSLVVSPNAHQISMINNDENLLSLYQEAELTLPDGMSILLASKLIGNPLKQRITGSDFVPAFFEQYAHDHPLKIFFLGGKPGVADKAKSKLIEEDTLTTVKTHSPSMGFEKDPDENTQTIKKINDFSPDILFVALGTPRQEIWLTSHADRLNVSVGMGVGATFDFIAGEKKRAPEILQKMGLEWFHRLLSEPQRLGKRYLVTNSHFCYLLLQELVQEDLIP